GEQDRHQAQRTAAQGPHRERGQEHGGQQRQQPALPGLHGEGADRGEDPEQAQGQRVQGVGRDLPPRRRGRAARVGGGQREVVVGGGDQLRVVGRDEDSGAAGRRLGEQG